MTFPTVCFACVDSATIFFIKHQCIDAKDAKSTFSRKLGQKTKKKSCGVTYLKISRCQGLAYSTNFVNTAAVNDKQIYA